MQQPLPAPSWRPDIDSSIDHDRLSGRLSALSWPAGQVELRYGLRESRKKLNETGQALLAEFVAEELTHIGKGHCGGETHSNSALRYGRWGYRGWPAQGFLYQSESARSYCWAVCHSAPHVNL